MSSSELPPGGERFLADTQWKGATVHPLPGDASFRRYFRLRKGASSAMLMFAPPPHEDPEPFLTVAKWLCDNGFRAPDIIAEDAGKGFVLLEDFGDIRLREWLEDRPDDEEALYGTAVDTLIALRDAPTPDFDQYDLPTYLREARLFVEWYCNALDLTVDESGWDRAWEDVLQPVMLRQDAGICVLRDYHAENIMLLHPDGDAAPEQGLIDFQDALAGHPAYDLVSLLQDARRDVSPEIEVAMLDRYLERTGEGDQFRADYAILGAQRNAKIVGIFVRLARRDGKSHYLRMIPRVWRLLERDLLHPALQPVADWFDANIPADVRENHGGISA